MIILKSKQEIAYMRKQENFGHVHEVLKDAISQD